MASVQFGRSPFKAPTRVQSQNYQFHSRDVHTGCNWIKSFATGVGFFCDVACGGSNRLTAASADGKHTNRRDALTCNRLWFGKHLRPSAISTLHSDVVTAGPAMLLTRHSTTPGRTPAPPPAPPRTPSSAATRAAWIHSAGRSAAEPADRGCCGGMLSHTHILLSLSAWVALFVLRLAPSTRVCSSPLAGLLLSFVIAFCLEGTC